MSGIKTTGLTGDQVRRFLDDGFFIVQDLLPRAAIQPLIDARAETGCMQMMRGTHGPVVPRLPGFVARSSNHPDRVGRSARDWTRV